MVIIVFDCMIESGSLILRVINLARLTFQCIYKRDVYGVGEGLVEVAQFNSSTSSGLLVPPIPSSGKHQSYMIHTQSHFCNFFWR